MNKAQITTTFPFRKADNISLVSLGIIIVFWSSIFSFGIFDLIGQIKGQLVLLLAWLVSLFFFGTNAWRKAVNNLKRHSLEIFLFSVFIFITAIHLILGNGDQAYSHLVNQLIIFVVYLSVIIHFKNDSDSYEKVIIFILIGIVLNSIYVIPILFNYPFIARQYDYSQGEILWFGSWSFFMPIAITLPCFIAVILKKKGFFKLALILCVIPIFTMIILSTFAASIILMFFGVLGLLILSIKEKVKYLSILLLLIVIMLLFVNYFDFSDLPQVSAMVEKIGTIFTFKSDLGGDENDPRIRASLAKVSINTFLSNPIFGGGLYGPRDDGNNIIGDHSGILDSLAQYGFFGVIWYFGFLYMCFRGIIFEWRKDSTILNKARVITFVLFIVGAFGNPVLFNSSFVSLVLVLSVSPISKNMQNIQNIKSSYNNTTI